MASESKNESNSGIGVRVRKLSHETDTSLETQALISDDEEPPLDFESFSTNQLRTAFFTKMQKSEEQWPISGPIPIQKAIDKLVMAPKEKTKHNSLIDYLNLSSLLLRIISFSELSWRQFPSFPVASAAETPHSEPGGSSASFKKPVSDTTQKKTDSPESTGADHLTTPTLPFGASRLEQRFLNAINQKNLEEVNKYLEKSQLVKRLGIPDKEGVHPIMYAAKSGEKDILEAILDTGTPVDVQTSTGETTLTIAAHYHNPEILKTLFNYGANCFHRTQLDMTAQDILRYYATQNKQDKSIAESMVVLLSIEFYSAFDKALFDKNDALALTSLDKLKDINKNKYINTHFLHGYTLLATAVASDNFKFVTELIDRGADVNLCTKNYQKDTPLQIAAQQGQNEIVKLLLDKGAEVNKAKNMDFLPITYAVRGNHHRIAKELLERGSYKNFFFQNGETLLDIVGENGDALMAKILLDHGETLRVTVLQSAIYFDHRELLTTLLDSNKIDIKKSFPEGFVPIIYAANLGRKHIFTTLAQAGANLHAFDIEGTLEYHATKGGLKKEFDEAVSSQKAVPDDKVQTSKKPETTGGYTPYVITAIFGVIFGAAIYFYSITLGSATKKPALTEAKKEKQKIKKIIKKIPTENKKEPKAQKEVVSEPPPPADIQKNPPEEFNYDDISADLAHIRNESTAEIENLDKYQQELNRDIKLKYKFDQVNNTIRYQFDFTSQQIKDSKVALESIIAEAESLLLKKDSSILEPYLKLKAQFDNISKSLNVSAAPAVRSATETQPSRQKNDWMRFYAQETSAPQADQKKSASIDAELKQSKTHQSSWRFPPSESKALNPVTPIVHEKKKKQPNQYPSYAEKMKLVDKLIMVFNEAGIGEDSIFNDKKESKNRQVIAKGLAIPPKLAILFAILLVAEIIKHPHFRKNTTAREHLENIRNNLGHATNRFLEKNLTEIVPAAVEFFKKVQDVTREGFDESHLQSFESPILNSLIEPCVNDEKSVVSVQLFDKFSADFGEAWSKLDKEDGSKSARTIVYELAINFLVANPTIRDMTEIYHSNTVAADLRELGNDWRHNGAMNYLQQLLADFTPTSESLLELNC